MKTKIIVHCSATPPSMDIGAKEIRRWHVEDNGWDDIGYNLVIRRNGMFDLGRDLDGDGDVFEEQGAHARGHNKASIGICLIGGVNSKMEPDSNFSLEQLTALKFVVNLLKTLYPDIREVVGHRDLFGVNKDCPCFNVEELLK